MQQGGAPSVGPGSAAAAVIRAAATQLAAADPRGPTAFEDLARLLAVTEDLLRRAEFDDLGPARRAHATGARRTGAELADQLAALDAHGDRLRELVATLRGTDIGPLPASDRLDLPAPTDTPATSATAIAGYLRSRGERRELVSATAVGGGFSKETVLVTLRGSDGDEELVLRKVAAGRVADTLPGEYEVLRFVAAHGLAVPHPLWMDTNGGALGGPLFATNRLPGRPVGTVTGPSTGATASTARELAALLGRLHSLDVAELGGTPRPAMTSTQDLRGAIDEREKIVRQVAGTLPETPGLALHRALLTWLRATLPATDAPTVLVHGDVGFHNLLVDDGRLTALLDWELAHRGRPAEDLAYMRPSVQPLLDWTEFLDLYRAAGGLPADGAELRFFTVWQDLWRATSCLRLRTKFVLDPSRLSDGISGMLLGVRFLDSALRTAFGDPP